MTIALDLLLGYATSIVPFTVMYMAPRNNDFDYASIMASIPIFFALTSFVIVSLIDILNIPRDLRFIFAGITIAAIYSSIGRFTLNIPNEILNIDPSDFQLYAFLVWIVVYFIVYQIRDRI